MDGLLHVRLSRWFTSHKQNQINGLHEMPNIVMYVIWAIAVFLKHLLFQQTTLK